VNIANTGICGFVGSKLALHLCDCFQGARIAGIDNLSRPGSETTRGRLKAAGIVVKHGDIRCASDLESLGGADWVVDAAARASRRRRRPRSSRQRWNTTSAEP
jgi:CDP-paratose 2-epimerase